MIHYIDELKTEELKGKKVLLRLDLNVPMKDGKILDDFDIQKIIPTVDFLRKHEAQAIILAHAESKEGENETLLPVWDYFKGYFPCDFCPSYFTPEAIDKVTKLEDKGVLLFENVRVNLGEKENDIEFAKKLAQMGDLYVNDAFGVSHREHASIVGLPQFLPHYGGLLMREEITNLSKAFHPEHPFIFILGGAKFETKLPIIEKYAGIADKVFVGGALANNFFSIMGFELGTSLVAKGEEFSRENLRKTLNNNKMELPRDVTVTKKDGEVEFKIPDTLGPDECIVDVGPQTITQIKELIAGAKTIVWNGPLGNYEAGFGDKTEQLAELLAEVTKSGAETIIGGGDTLAVIHKLDILDKFSFVSTGGGAMLDFLANETLPGIQALEK